VDIDSLLAKEDLESPEILDKAASRIIGILSAEQKRDVKMLQEEDLIDLHLDWALRLEMHLDCMISRVHY